MEDGSGDLDEVFAQNLLEGYVDTSGHTHVIRMALQPCFHFTKDINLTGKSTSELGRARLKRMQSYFKADLPADSSFAICRSVWHIPTAAFCPRLCHQLTG